MKICLVVVFNHRFEQNLPFLRAYYSSKFSHIRFLMPFADDLAEKENDVISVHYSSYIFQGFFGEARKSLGALNCDAFVIVGDDLIVNESLNESNIHPRMNLPQEHAYIKNLASLYDSPISLSRNRSTYRAFFSDGFHWENDLPSASEAFEKSNKYGISHRPLGFRNFPPLWTRRGAVSLATALSWLMVRDHSRRLFAWQCKEVIYPAFYSYSDFLIIPGLEWDRFARYCEVTAAMQMFVESAIPLAMVLACEKVDTEFEYGEKHDARSPKRRMPMRGIEVPWGGVERVKFEESFEKDFDLLVDSFETDILYYHPVKLSRWKTRRYASQPIKTNSQA
jgi:hypothetical protein